MKHLSGFRSSKCRIIFVIVLTVVLLFTLYIFQVRPSIAASRLLNAVGLDTYQGLHRIDYAAWTDPLKYTDGYEILALNVDGGRFAAPLNWKSSETPVSVSAIAQELDLPVNESAFLDLSLGGCECSAWMCIDKSSESIPFENREFYLVWCYPDYGEERLLIYHGHHLYGL